MPHLTDTTKLQGLQNRILTRKGLICCGAEFTATLHSRGRAAFVGADRYGQRSITAVEELFSLFCGETYTAAILKDGTIHLAGRSPVGAGFATLSYVRMLSCGKRHVAALLGNGRVMVSPGGQPYAKGLEEWPDVVDVLCGDGFTVGLTPEGRVQMAGGSHHLRRSVATWEQVAGLFVDAEGQHIFGITAEGRLLATSSLPRVAVKWRNLVFLAAACGELWGITAAGQLLSTTSVEGLVKGSEFLVACAAASDHVVVLTRDGRVLATGEDRYGQCDTQRLGGLFESFEEFSNERLALGQSAHAREREYQTRLVNARRYSSRLLCGRGFTACVTADGHVLTTAGFGEAKQWTEVRALAAGNAHLVTLCSGGIVRADGNDTDGCTDVSHWTRVSGIAAGKYHTLGVTEEGEVLFCGRNDKKQGDVTQWKGIKRVYAADSYTVGLGYDGRVWVAGEAPFKNSITQEEGRMIVDLVVTSTCMVALLSNGRVLVGKSEAQAEKKLLDWEGVRAISAEGNVIAGLCYGGRVLVTGLGEEKQRAVASWKGMVAVACGEGCVLGLRQDGRVLSVGELTEGVAFSGREASAGQHPAPPRLSTDGWQGVMALAVGHAHAVAMTETGGVLALGDNREGQCSLTAHFTLFRDPRQLYGHGRHRRLEDYSEGSPSRAEEDMWQKDHALVPFSLFSAHLRRDAQALSARMTGGNEHLSVLSEAGLPVTYRYETAETHCEAETEGVRDMATLGEATLLIREDGMAYLRDSRNLKGELTTLPDKLGSHPFYRVRQVAEGKQHYVVLLRDGTVRAFGDNSRGQCDTGDWRGITAVSAGDYHTVGLRADGTVVATGARHRGSGNRSRSATAHLPRANPCAVDAWTGITAISCAEEVTLGLASDGTVRAVGSNLYGQCYTKGWRGVVFVATSGSHTVALFADGHVEAVGRNQNRECATEDWDHVIQICVLPGLTLGLRSDGRILVTGGHNEVLHTLEAVRAMTCLGPRRVALVLSDGTLRCHTLGREYLPETPEGIRLFTPSTSYSILHRYSSQSPASHTARRVLGCFGVGMAHRLALGKGGVIRTEGVGSCGQLDLGSHGAAVQIAAGYYHSAVILANGQLLLSGRNTVGQADAYALNRELDIVGVAAEETRNATVGVAAEPDPTDLPYAWRQVACGWEHTVALRSDGRVYAIGQNEDGRCDTRQWRDVIYLACGLRHTVGLTAEGGCVATGDNRYGQCDVSRWRRVTMVAAGEFHTVALCEDGRVEAVGDNRRGQCRVEDLRHIVSVACLPEATLCVTAEGRVILRGGNGLLDRTMESLREIVAVHACEHRVALLTVDRRVLFFP